MQCSRFITITRYSSYGKSRRFANVVSEFTSFHSTSYANMSTDSARPVKGEFRRTASEFINKVTADGSSGFKAEANRYHLYVSLACPFAHRTLIARALKGLDDVISYTVVDYFRVEPEGWRFTDERPKCTLDTVTGSKFLREVYKKADPDYEGRISTPALWDKQKKTIVSNDSGEIMRMFSSEFNAFCKTPEQRNLNLYPDNLKVEIDKVNEWVFPQINNGVYRCGFAQSQEAYDIGIKDVFEGLDKVEEILSRQRYMTGNQFTDADIRLFTTLVRFDNVYHTHFKCNKKQIINYPNIWGFARDVYQTPGVCETVDFEHIIRHYYMSHLHINPFGIVPVCPMPDFTEPHGRDRF